MLLVWTSDEHVSDLGGGPTLLLLGTALSAVGAVIGPRQCRETQD